MTVLATAQLRDSWNVPVRLAQSHSTGAHSSDAELHTRTIFVDCATSNAGRCSTMRLSEPLPATMLSTGELEPENWHAAQLTLASGPSTKMAAPQWPAVLWLKTAWFMSTFV